MAASTVKTEYHCNYGVPSVKDEIACNLAKIACNLAKLQIPCNLVKLQISCNLATAHKCSVNLHLWLHVA